MNTEVKKENTVGRLGNTVEKWVNIEVRLENTVVKRENNLVM